MSQPYSVRFYAGTVGAASTITAYTVPSGYLAIVQHLDGRPHLAAADTLSLGLNSTPATVPIILSSAALAPSQQWQGKFVFNEGEGILLTTGVHAWDVQLTGALLFLSS